MCDALPRLETTPFVDLVTFELVANAYSCICVFFFRPALDDGSGSVASGPTHTTRPLYVSTQINLLVRSQTFPPRRAVRFLCTAEFDCIWVAIGLYGSATQTTLGSVGESRKRVHPLHQWWISGSFTASGSAYVLKITFRVMTPWFTDAFCPLPSIRAW
ncbi:hypothetical protein BDM02DRAFT_1215866 [Thelephora ganbajun]|uniref:Uncharacterized protein n=1 Tax=Thelephora ganbajun TaxID=370292 RepID=A0ACB6ZMZ9_THEGA|nr:hypothetical protein BDM02DRAFT_1215866 [Thelephora ganbajun]